MNPFEEKHRYKLWYATTQIDEYFRLLGGSGCYQGYCDWHVPALLTLALDQYSGNQEESYERLIKQLISFQMWEQTDGLPQRALELIAKIETLPEDIDWFMNRVSEHYPMSYSSHKKVGWADFIAQRRRRKSNL